MSHQRDVIEQKGPNQIVRIRSDSETNLDDLFKAVMHPKGSQVPMSVPMRLRNLPPSFFQQPERGSKSASHSRESSTDNTYSSPTPPATPVSQSNTGSSSVSQSGLPINHPRAHSSPATLQQTYNNNTAQHQHLRQQSYDITDDIPLPPGWEMAKTATGQKYFLNHITQTTTWEDPRKKLPAGAATSPTTGKCSSQSLLNLQNLGPLPDGWEQATTPEGEVYFINHKDRTTSWYDPRIPMHLQQPPLIPVVTGQGTITHQTQAAPQLPGPPPTQQSSSPTAEGITTVTSANSQLNLQQQQQKLRLQRLQLERERLRMRQQEILRQSTCFGNPVLNEMMMRHTLREEGSLTTSPTNSTPDVRSTTTTTTTTTTNIDPFLGGGTDFHSRQESADSGLGLGPNYSLPNTPEDYLISMDDSTTDLNAELSLESLQGSNLDLVPENMDSDDLVPSLQEELNADDILSDVEALLNNKETVMKWL